MTWPTEDTNSREEESRRACRWALPTFSCVAVSCSVSEALCDTGSEGLREPGDGTWRPKGPESLLQHTPCLQGGRAARRERGICEARCALRSEASSAVPACTESALSPQGLPPVSSTAVHRTLALEAWLYVFRGLVGIERCGTDFLPAGLVRNFNMQMFLVSLLK